MITGRLDWIIIKGAMWVATYIDGTTLVARNKVRLMTEINEYEKTLG